MDHMAEIRRRPFISGESINEMAKNLKLSRPSVRKALQTETEPIYQRHVQLTPKSGDFKGQLTDWPCVVKSWQDDVIRNKRDGLSPTSLPKNKSYNADQKSGFPCQTVTPNRGGDH
jgi:hypothetical protein